MTLVLDASAAASWVLPDETGAESLLALARRRYLVPPVFACEIVYLLQRAERRGRVTEAQVYAGLDFLSALRIEIVPDDGFDALGIQRVSRRYGLSSYDAAYLRLAIDQELPLATLDVHLAEVALAVGITVAP